MLEGGACADSNCHMKHMSIHLRLLLAAEARVAERDAILIDFTKGDN